MKKAITVLLIPALGLTFMVVLYAACGGGGSGGIDVLDFAEPAYFVSVDDPAAGDSNPGTMELPFAGIQAAIDAAAAAFSTAHVYVAEGDYLVSYQSGTHIVLAEGILVHGGYAANWSTRDRIGHPSLITDTSATGGVSSNTANRAVHAGPVTGATTIDGFNITSGAGTYSAGIYIDDGSPTISGNTIDGGSGSFYAMGIAIFDGSPTISGNVITGGTSSGHCAGIRIESGAGPVIDGNIIDGGTCADTTGISQRSSSTVTIHDNTIFGGEGNYESTGLYNESDSTPSVEGNTIDGGSASTTYGIRNYQTGPSVFAGNTISGGAGVDYSYGIKNYETAPLTITGNTIDGGSAHDSMGIFSFATSLIVIEANVISGGSDTFCYGVYETEGTANDIRNNLIYAGTGPFGYGVAVWGASPKVRNNTIDAGSGGTVYGIYFTFLSQPEVENNIIMGSGTGYGIYEGSLDTGPATVNNNDIFDFSYAFVDQDSGCGGNQVCTIEQMEALGDMTASGNVSLDPVLQDIDGADDVPATMDDNLWTLTAGSPSAVTGSALDLSADFTGDFDGTTRTVPWSMGAYEY